MEIRQASAADVPKIVELLKSSLGEGLMPKSETFWNWKHQQNPFGPSPVLLATEGEQIIGVRAFMSWSWIRDGKRVSAVRAVDTATHPDFQGKGIFSKLTKRLLDNCQGENVGLVFNTPNTKSMPGYLKMGWEKAGKLPVRVKVMRPLNIGLNYLARRTRPETEIENDQLFYFLQHRGLEALLDKYKELNRHQYITDYSPAYLNWRYGQVPVARYHAAGVEEENRLKALIIYRLKRTPLGNEMRITEVIFDSPGLINSIRKRITQIGRKVNADYITTEGVSEWNLLGRWSITKSVGPMVTVRKLTETALTDWYEFKNWHPGVGDLELF